MEPHQILEQRQTRAKAFGRFAWALRLRGWVSCLEDRANCMITNQNLIFSIIVTWIQQTRLKVLFRPEDICQVVL